MSAYDFLYAVLEDGPVAGTVAEVALTCKLLDVHTDNGTIRYQRFAFGTSNQNHRIAKFHFVHETESSCP